MHFRTQAWRAEVQPGFLTNQGGKKKLSHLLWVKADFRLGGQKIPAGFGPSRPGF